jgi:hypothetical protein
VQRHIRAALDGCAPGPIRLVSLCAGQGHDVLGALEGHPRAADVQARLVELDPVNCAAARANAPAPVDVVCGDASSTSVYAGAVPAEVVLANGVFGNISDADIEHTVDRLPTLCAPNATVVWTRHRRPPDVTPAIREWFATAGFEEVTFEAPDGFIFGVGVHRLVRDPEPFTPGVTLFEFVGSDQGWNPNPPAASTGPGDSPAEHEPDP